MTETRREGFWYSEREPDLPMPEGGPNQWKGQWEFICALKAVERFAGATHYRGLSRCRLCQKPNGSITYSHKGWEWPQGLMHYVETHNVEPSDDFVKFILEEANV